MPNPVDRVAALAETLKPLRLILSIIAAPFYVIGFAVGLLIVALTWAYAAVQVGISDARRDDQDAG